MTSRPGLVLAGGLSRRMGENKALLPFGSQRLVDHVLEGLARQCNPILLNAPAPIVGTGAIAVVPDDIEGHSGPLAGIAAGLRHVATLGLPATHMLSVAVDTPFFPENLADALSAIEPGADEIIVATDLGGRWHPTFALWPVSLEADLRAWLGDPENRKVRAFIERHPHRTVSFPLIPTGGGSIEPFFNINTPEEYRRALSLMAGQA
jgi:molybdopterin-guanine dinucleotide biosynthesis protein A